MALTAYASSVERGKASDAGMNDYLTKPMYFFAKVGFGFFLASLAIAAITILQKYGWFFAPEEGVKLHRNVLVQVSLTLFVTTLLVLLVGVVSELLVRIYHESQDLRPYRVRATYRQGEGTPEPPAREPAPADETSHEHTFRRASNRHDLCAGPSPRLSVEAGLVVGTGMQPNLAGQVDIEESP